MAAPRFSVLAALLLCACAHSQAEKNIKVESQVEGCFTLQNIALDTSKEPVLATALININTATTDCPCKSAVMKYMAYQKKDGNNFDLLSGQFSILGKESVALPIAVQKQLIFPDIPIYLSLSCSNN